MKSLKEIKTRINSVMNTQKITKAMKLVAAARLRKSQDAAIKARNYADELEQLAYRVSESVGVDAPLLMRRRSDVSKLDLIVIASDRGLCGGFNENLVNSVNNVVAMHARHGVEIKLMIIGKKGVDACRKRKLKIASYEKLGEDTSMIRVKAIVDTATQRFTEGTSDGSFVAYNYFRSASIQEVVFKDLLPLHGRGRDRAYRVDYLFEPNRDAILNELVNNALTAILMQAFRESHTSELAARMMAMNAATKNADDMIELLTMLYNRARQSVITRELMDIVNGAEALR